MRKSWTKTSIIKEIKTLHKQRVGLNSGSIRKTHRYLMSSACYIFGSWKEAIEASGIKYESIAIKPFKSERELWDKNKVINEIIILKSQGKDLNARHICLNNGKLYGAASTHFGSWRLAIKEAGITYTEIAKRPDFKKWSKKLIIAKIKERMSLDLPMNSHSVEEDDFTLWSASFRYFGSWKKAFIVAGFDSSTICTSRTWTKIQVLEEIMTLHKNHVDLSMVNMEKLGRRDLLNAARKHFYGWRQALESLGFKYETIRKTRTGYWSSEQVIKEITLLALEGERLSHGWAKLNHNGLVHAALKYFGSWNKALESSGLNYKNHAKTWSTRAWLERLNDEEYFNILRRTTYTNHNKGDEK